VGEGTIAMTSVAGNSSKFGIPLTSNRKEIIQAFKKYSWLSGLHIHIGSQGCDLEQLVRGGEVINELKDEINQELKTNRIDLIDIGGGLPADYGFNQRSIEVLDYVGKLKKSVPGLFQQTILTEFGRSILANCAWAVSRIQYLKNDFSDLTCVIHFGADFLMRPVYASNEWKHEYIVLDSIGRLSKAPKCKLSIAGPLCFSGDYLERNTIYPQPDTKGYIVVKDVGAYTLSTWSRHCNRRLPKVLGYKKRAKSFEFRVLYQGESLQDIVDFWS
jgi:diaminopimelate decarboxylase